MKSIFCTKSENFSSKLLSILDSREHLKSPTPVITFRLISAGLSRIAEGNTAKLSPIHGAPLDHLAQQLPTMTTRGLCFNLRLRGCWCECDSHRRKDSITPSGNRDTFKPISWPPATFRSQIKETAQYRGISGTNQVNKNATFRSHGA